MYRKGNEMAKRTRNRFNIDMTEEGKKKKIAKDGIKFASVLEKEFYEEVIIPMRFWDMKITDYELQPKFILLDSFKHKYSGTIRQVDLVLDFKITCETENGKKRTYYIDIKGDVTDVAKLKKKFFLEKNPKKRLIYLTRATKGDGGGWIEYEEFLENRRKRKKEKKEKEKNKGKK